MSRFTCKTIKDGKEYEIAYGFDRPLGEYFIQVYDPSKNEEENEDGLIVWEGSRMTGKSNSEMCKLMETWEVPEHHISGVALDLPIGYTDNY